MISNQAGLARRTQQQTLTLGQQTFLNNLEGLFWAKEVSARVIWCSILCEASLCLQLLIRMVQEHWADFKEWNKAWCPPGQGRASNPERQVKIQKRSNYLQASSSSHLKESIIPCNQISWSRRKDKLILLLRDHSHLKTRISNLLVMLTTPWINQNLEQQPQKKSNASQVRRAFLNLLIFVSVYVAGWMTKLLRVNVSSIHQNLSILEVLVACYTLNSGINVVRTVNLNQLMKDVQ